eukprot:2604266-Rhodomonas_salina.2
MERHQSHFLLPTLLTSEIPSTNPLRACCAKYGKTSFRATSVRHTPSIHTPYLAFLRRDMAAKSFSSFVMALGFGGRIGFVSQRANGRTGAETQASELDRFSSVFPSLKSVSVLPIAASGEDTGDEEEWRVEGPDGGREGGRAGGREEGPEQQTTGFT